MLSNTAARRKRAFEKGDYVHYTVFRPCVRDVRKELRVSGLDIFALRHLRDNFSYITLCLGFRLDGGGGAITRLYILHLIMSSEQYSYKK